MVRLISSLLLVTLLLVGPALCTGGLLEHPCDCGTGTDMECQHEESCAQDPCLSIASRPDRESQVVLELAMPSFQVAMVTWALKLGSGGRPPSASPHPPDRWSLPFAESDRPLLI